MYSFAKLCKLKLASKYFSHSIATIQWILLAAENLQKMMDWRAYFVFVQETPKIRKSYHPDHVRMPPVLSLIAKQLEIEVSLESWQLKGRIFGGIRLLHCN